jgi:hypothetical protein
MSAFEKTYKIEVGPPAPDQENYATTCKLEWEQLLQASPSEKEVQDFLERNPALVPGAWTPGPKSGHYPLHCALISQPILPGLRSRQPDLMWIAIDSLTCYPTLIEIEKPSKRIFNSSGVPSADFSQARNQLAQWRTWLSESRNKESLMDYYDPAHIRGNTQIEAHMILIYGRRSEFEEDPELERHRASLLPAHDEDLMSFDRINFDRNLFDAITIKLKRNGRYEAVAIPPVFTTGPHLAERLLHIDDIENALRKTPMISERRKSFLIRRIQYWREWARLPEKGFIGWGPE